MGRNAKLKAARREARQQALASGEPLARSKVYVLEDGSTYTHTEAPSLPWEPMERIGMTHMPLQDDAWADAAIWRNRWYECLARYYPSGFPLGDSAYTILSISHINECAEHDWRDLQAIKSDVCGAEWEGVELYPSESRLCDPSNRFYLWCVPPGVITWGLSVKGRRVWDMEQSVAPQRPFPR